MYIVKEGKIYRVYNFKCKLLFKSDNQYDCEKFILASGETLL